LKRELFYQTAREWNKIIGNLDFPALWQLNLLRNSPSIEMCTPIFLADPQLE
jgi:hypothetical protein